MGLCVVGEGSVLFAAWNMQLYSRGRGTRGGHLGTGKLRGMFSNGFFSFIFFYFFLRL